MLSKVKILIVLGILTVILAFMGIPYSIKKWIFVVFGVLVIAFAGKVYGLCMHLLDERRRATESKPIASDVSSTPSASLSELSQ